MLKGLVRYVAVGTAVAASLSLSVYGHAQEKQEDRQVVAVVDGEKLYARDFQAAYSSLPPRIRKQGLDKLYPHVLELLIQQALIIKKGHEAGLADDPTIKRRLQAMEDRLIHDAFLNRRIESRISEEKIRAAYDRYLENNPAQQEVHARHILVDTEDKARNIIAMIGEGEDFATLAEQYSKGPSAAVGGDLGYFGRGKMVKSFEDAAFALDPNTYTADPVKTDYGWHVILVEDIRESDPPRYEDLRPQLARQVGQSMAYTVSREIVENAKIERFDMNGNAIEAPDKPLPSLQELQQQ